MHKCTIGDLIVNGAVNTEKVKKIFSDSKPERTLTEDSQALLEALSKKSQLIVIFVLSQILYFIVNFDFLSTVPKETANDANFHAVFIIHVMAENFVNCPKMEEKEECQDLRGAIRECIEKGDIENFVDAFSTPN